MKEPTQIITVNQKKNAHLEDDYSRDEEVYLDYDTSIYDFIHQDNTIILRKYKEEILKVFPEDLSFIVQTQIDGKSHFLVADRKCSKKNNQALTKVRHYIDSYPAIKNLTDFHLEREFDCKETNIEECQLTERSYIIKQKDDKKVIYNFKQATIAFDEVYNDENLRELLGENKVLVSKKLYAPHSQFIEDTITFGINPDTLEENTPIWSDLQQRNVSSYSEILKYLSLTEQYVDEPVGVYTYDKGTDLNDRNRGIQVINTQFVKKFTSSFNNTN